MAKSYANVFLAYKFLFVGSDAVAVGCIVNHKTLWKKTSRRKRERDFFETLQPRVHWFIAHYFLLLRTWEDRHRELCSTRLSGSLSLGAFIISNRLKRIVRLFYRQRFILVTPHVVRSTIGYRSNSWASCFPYTRCRPISWASPVAGVLFLDQELILYRYPSWSCTCSCCWVTMFKRRWRPWRRFRHKSAAICWVHTQRLLGAYAVASASSPIPINRTFVLVDIGLAVHCSKSKGPAVKFGDMRT